MSPRTPLASHGARLLALLVALALLAPAAARAADADARAESPAPAVAPAEATVAPAPVVKAPDGAESAPAPAARATRPTPMFVAMMVVFDEGRKQIDALEARLAATTDHAQAVAIEREIARVHTQTEVGMLRVQSDFARRAGRAQLADRIDSAIREILSPTPLPAPESVRPAPGADAAPQR